MCSPPTRYAPIPSTSAPHHQAALSPPLSISINNRRPALSQRRGVWRGRGCGAAGSQLVLERMLSHPQSPSRQAFGVVELELRSGFGSIRR